MRDREVVALAAAVWIGALASWAVPRALGIALVVIALAARRPLLLVLGALLLSCSFGAAAHDGLAPAAPHHFEGDVLLVTDPVDARGGAVGVDVRAGSHRFEAIARGPAARALRPRAAGERVRLIGDVEPRRDNAPWLEVRHIVGRLDVERVEGVTSGSPAMRVANGIRGALTRGADALPQHQRRLYTGLVFGDDRGQPAILVDDLRAAGLGHLLAVSGQNVAVMLGAARPLLERCRHRVRFPATLALLGVLVLVTRAEPSVLRAAAMSGVVALANAIGRPSSALRVLTLAVTLLVLVDPMLVHALGFQLSVSASAGIVLLSRRFAARIPLPDALAEMLGVTLAAQLAVAPIVLASFGGIPVASLPANLLAAPAAAPVMVWGATAGVVAGAAGGWVATLLHLPTRVLIWWIEVVAGNAGRVPLGELRAPHVVAICVAAVVAAKVRGQHAAAVRALGALAIVIALLQPSVALRSVRLDGASVAEGVTLWRDRHHAVVVVDGRADPVRALDAVRRAGVSRIDLVVARTGAIGVGDVVRALDARYDLGAVWAPAGHAVRGASVPRPGVAVRAGPFVATVDSIDPRLVVHVRRA